MKIKVNRETLILMIKNREDVENLDTSGIIDMSNLFEDCEWFNQDISSWDVSNVTTMTSMFCSCDFFNQDISLWDVSNVKDMSCIFSSCTLFNQDLSRWNLTSVKNTDSMFSDCIDFNFKSFENKINAKMHILETYEIKSFDKKRLLEYLAIYKSNDPMKIKVLSKLTKEQILNNIFEKN